MLLKADIPIDKIAQHLTAKIPELLRAKGVQGASIALLRDGRCAWAGGFGVKNAETGELVTPDTVFEAYSCTKPLVAYKALAMCEKGLLDLDRPLDDYLPEPYIADDLRSGHITLKMVLSHTSGLPDDPDDVEKRRILFTPGKQWSYSTAGFYYLQRVIDEVADIPFAQNMQTHLLEPLSMDASSFVWQDRLLPHMAQGHDKRGIPQAIRRITTADADSLLTTPTDYAKFMAQIIRPVGAFGLDEHSTAEMTRGQVKIAARLSWGLGWGIQHTDAGDCFWQFGGGEGAPFQNFALTFKESGIGIAIMTNSANGESVFADLVDLAIGGEYPIFPWDSFVGAYFASSNEGQ